MLTEYKGESQHRFRSKCDRYVFLNLPPKKNMEVIPFILIPSIELALGVTAFLMTNNLHSHSVGNEINQTNLVW